MNWATRPWARAALVGAIAGAVVACFMLYVALQHNPQQEFADEAGVKWGSLALVGASWFVPVWMALTLLARLALRRDAHPDAGPTSS